MEKNGLVIWTHWGKAAKIVGLTVLQVFWKPCATMTQMCIRASTESRVYFFGTYFPKQ